MKMELKKPDTFWTSLALFVIGIVIVLKALRFNFPDLVLNVIALLIGIGFIIASYGLWIMKKWGAILGLILCSLELVQISFSGLISFNPSTLISFIAYAGVILLISFQGWKKLKD